MNCVRIIEKDKANTVLIILLLFSHSSHSTLHKSNESSECKPTNLFDSLGRLLRVNHEILVHHVERRLSVHDVTVGGVRHLVLVDCRHVRVCRYCRDVSERQNDGKKTID